MKKMKALTFKEKQIAIKSVINQYRRAKLKLLCIEQHSYYPKVSYDSVRERKTRYNKSVSQMLNQRIDDQNELKEIIVSFEQVIEILSENSKLIIVHDFIEVTDGEWWSTYFSRASYYRSKTRAMEEFLFYINI